MPSPARASALRVLLDVERGAHDLPQALARVRPSLQDRRDEALVAEIAIGTLRWRAALDHAIAAASRRPLSALDPDVLAILRLSAYQLLHLTRVPASAAVHDAVELVRAARKASAAGFVNAVLRKVAGGRDQQALPQSPGDEVTGDERRTRLLDYFSITLSHPRWLAARWLDRYGEAAAEAWLHFNNREAPLTLRANTLKISAVDLAVRLAEHGVSTRPARFSPDGSIVTAGNPWQTPLHADGLFLGQDEASQLVGLMLPVKPGATILDACAAPGGKTTQLAARLGDGGRLIASDLRPRRVGLLRETLARAGARGVRLAQADFAAGAPFAARFDAALLDAPCSGLGTLRSDPDLKWKRQEPDLAALAATARLMLDRVAGVVRPGGHLLYSTCSSEPEENENDVAGFLADHPDFLPADRATVCGAIPGDVVDEAGHLRTFPHRHDLEAFFGALLVRRG